MKRFGLNSGYIGVDRRQTEAGIAPLQKAYLERVRGGGYLPVIPLLLDLYPGAAAAYSLRKLRTAYTGSAIRVRRASDNTEQDIGFDTSGNLDTSALTAFCSGTSGFVTTWYDQSGNGENLVQNSSLLQPKIYDSSSGIVTLVGNPAILFDGSNDYMYRNFPFTTPQPVYIEIVTTFPGDTRFVFDSSPSPRIALLSWNGATNAYAFAGLDLITTTGTFVPGTRYLFSLLFSGFSSAIYQNTTLRRTGDAGPNAISDLYLGARYTLQNYADMAIQEMVLWPSDLTSSRLNIANNINTYYSIY